MGGGRKREITGTETQREGISSGVLEHSRVTEFTTLYIYEELEELKVSK